MIKEITIDGFKSLRKISIEIKPITILIGLNSSGKSSVLQCLEVLKQTANGRSPSYLITNGELINLGSFKDIVFLKEENKAISFEIKGCRKSSTKAPFGNEIAYDYSFSVDSNGLKNQLCIINSGNFLLEGEYNRAGSNKTIKVPVFNGTISFNPINYIGEPFQFAGSIDGNVEGFNFEDLSREFLPVIKQDLISFFMVPAIRGISSPSYPLGNRAFDDLADSNNLYNQAIKFSSTVVYNSLEIERKINKWIGRITGITIKARTVPDKQAAIEASRKIDTNIVNEGFGSNQLVHLFAQIAVAPPHSVIGIEEPEVHLHPKAQSELSKVLIEIAKEERKNLIITTHSEHVLYRVMIEIARGKLNTEDVALYHFALSDDGYTKVERLKIDSKGRLERGIPDFFETDLDEFKDFLDALKA